jgi:hypothetical protein
MARIRATLKALNKRVVIPASAEIDFTFTIPDDSVFEWRETTFIVRQVTATVINELIKIKRIAITLAGEVDEIQLVDGDREIAIAEFAGTGQLPRIMPVLQRLQGGEDIVITVRNDNSGDADVSLTLWGMLTTQKELERAEKEKLEIPVR